MVWKLGNLKSWNLYMYSYYVFLIILLEDLEEVCMKEEYRDLNRERERWRSGECICLIFIISYEVFWVNVKVFVSMK